MPRRPIPATPPSVRPELARLCGILLGETLAHVPQQLRRLLHACTLTGIQIEFDHPLHPVFPHHARRAEIDALDPVLALQQGGDGEDRVLVAQMRCTHSPMA